MKLSRDLREFIGLLNSRRVEYVVIGAYSLAFHGHPRYTGDLDLFVNPSEENASRLISVLDDFGFANLGLGHSDFVERDQIVQLGRSPNRIDLLTGITGVNFEEAWETRLSAEIDGLPVFMISKELLLKNKRAIGRPQDHADIASLELDETKQN